MAYKTNITSDLWVSRHEHSVPVVGTVTLSNVVDLEENLIYWMAYKTNITSDMWVTRHEHSVPVVGTVTLSNVVDLEENLI